MAIGARVYRLAVVVKAAAGLATEPPRGHVHLEHVGGSVLVVAELAMEHFGDRQAGVQADQVGQRQRPHRVVEPELDPGVDVLGRAQVFLQREASLVDQRNEDPVDDEARAVEAGHHRLAKLFGQGLGGLRRSRPRSAARE